MKLEQLRVFLAVAEHLHFTRAADSLYITQPAVSASIQTLEEEYGVKLFHRIGRHIELTDAGEMLQIEAQKILDQVELTAQGLRELNDLQRGGLKVGSSLTVGNYWLPHKISHFKQQYPGISIHCTIANAEEIVSGTVSGLFDLGLVTGEVKASLSQNLSVSMIGQDVVTIVVGQSHAWFGRDRISLAEITDTAWIMREPGSGSRYMFERSLQGWGVDPSTLEIALILTTSEMIKAVVEGGIGAAALPRSIVRSELKLGTLKAIEIVDDTDAPQHIYEMTQPVILLRHQKRFRTRISKAFEEVLVEPEKVLV
ncbi:LysR family transcriptional regulator [Phormidium tenue]|uniref:LysR family transcriptional regulator n=1 Tax=Phormidium tenue NIES-30 TaxID=549789 RepID=A0A1U7IYR0_9CYAN|nr:LysR family transcriptional regulator [Phormidium tenue]MBD2234727.1 LysR family transcriptional regulator [Phormidium tenue FACHB-1052]OKH43955.1 LysR family transcriptional regulator [Phormidium tenue NIES-30]